MTYVTWKKQSWHEKTAQLNYSLRS